MVIPGQSRIIFSSSQKQIEIEGKAETRLLHPNSVEKRNIIHLNQEILFSCVKRRNSRTVKNLAFIMLIASFQFLEPPSPLLSKEKTVN